MIVLLALSALAAEPWAHLDRHTVGADAFTADHPAWDGRGVVVAVLDCGVALGIPGLDQTCDGRDKILDARDFSGHGDVDLAVAVWRDGAPRHPDGWTVTGLPEVPVGSEDLLLGVITQEQFRDSDPDLDGDAIPGGRWAVAAAPVDGVWTTWVDTDGDGDLGDETPLHDYADDRSTFSVRGDGLSEGITRHVIAPTLLWRERVLSLHVADGSHGSHVAGIATGCGLGGVDGQDGVAPGAQVLSLKIGHNGLAGGATTTGAMERAFRYGARWSEVHDVPVVFNLSYGIDSSRESEAAIEAFLDELLAEHPDLVVVTSAGNSGPGISSVGNPATGRSVISVGSLYTRELAQVSWGRDLGRDRMAASSSRGGGSGDPDVVAPGVAFSAVPPWEDHAVFAGTSMASPEVAGVVALLLSAARAEGLEPTWSQVRRALQSTAEPRPGYGLLDQGDGVVQVSAAWQTLRRLARREGLAPLDYHVEVGEPLPPGTPGSAALWRADGWAPTGREGQEFTVVPVWAAGADPDAVVSATAELALRSDVSWLHADRPRLLLQGTRERTVRVHIDERILRQPGVHAGRILGTPVREGVPALELPVAVVVPEDVDTAVTWDVRLDPGEVQRHFLAVPAGASGLQARVRVTSDEGNVRAYLYDPDGARRQRPRISDEGWVRADPLEPGTWELDLVGGSDGPVRAEVEVRFPRLRVEPAALTALDGGGDTETSATLQLLHQGADALHPTVSGRVDRLRRTRELTADPTEGWRAELAPGPEVVGAELTLTVAPDDFAELTDAAFRVLDGSGEVVAAGGGDPEGSTVRVRGRGPWTVEVILAHADAEREEPLPFTLTEELLLAAPVDLSAAGPTLAPGLPVDVDLALSGGLPRVPEDWCLAGEVLVQDDGWTLASVDVCVPPAGAP